MKLCSWFGIVALGVLAVACQRPTKDSVPNTQEPETNLRQFAVQGIVRELKPDGQSVVIQHEATSNYMAAMTMPFKVRQSNELAGLSAGDEIKFRLWVSEAESWIDQIAKTGKRSAVEVVSSVQPTSAVQTASSGHPLLSYKFTNE